METKLMIQSTPNPNALKFVLSRPVKTEGKVTYKNAEECQDNLLAEKLLAIANVSEVFFLDNYITITQDGSGDWDAIEEEVQKTILDNIDQHNPDFKSAEELKPKSENTAPASPELEKIDMILNQTVRPALQADGGDLRLVDFQENVLKIDYQGACGSCPSATMGTLKAIESILQDEYHPEIVVELAY